MAFVFKPNQAKDKNNPQDNQASGQGQTLSSGQGSVITGQNPGAASPGNQKASSSGRFSNIQGFVKANDAGQLANNVTGKIGEEANKAQGQLGEAKSAVDKSSQATGEAVAAARGKLQGAQTGLQGAYSAQGGPVGEDAFKQNVDAYKQGLGLQYQGVEDLGNQGALQAQAQNLQSIGAATQNAAGRNALLNRFYGNPQYAAGQRTLDTVLLGSQRPKLQQAAAQANTFGGQLDTARRQALSQIGQARQDVTGVQDEAKQDVMGQIGQAQSAIGERATQAQGIRDLLRKQDSELQLQGDANTPQYTGDQRTNMAIQNAVNSGFMTQADADQYKNIQGRASNVGFDPRQLLNASLLSGTETGDQLNAIAASQQQASRVGALQGLVGQNSSYNPYSYDPNKVNQAVGDREGALVNALRNTDYNFAGDNSSNQQDIVATMAKLGLIAAPAAATYGALAGAQKLGEAAQGNKTLMNVAGATSGGIAPQLLKYATSQDLANNLGSLSNEQLNKVAGMQQFGAAASAANNKIEQARASAANAAQNAVSKGWGGVKKLFSDINLKENIKEFDTKPFLDSIKSYQYEYINKEHGEGLKVSPMAQDLEKTPEGAALVVDTPEGKMVDYSAALALILAALSDINVRITALEARSK